MQYFYANPNWAFIINFLFFFLAVTSILLTIKLPFEKEIGLIMWGTTQQEGEKSEPLVSEKYLYRLNLAFQNFGKSVIYKENIVGSIKVHMLGQIEIEHVTFLSNCKFITIAYEINNETLNFSFDFLEGKKYIQANIDYYSDKIIDAKVTGKIIGGNEINIDITKNTTWEKSYRVGDKEARAKIIIFPVITLLSISLCFQACSRMFNIDYNSFYTLILRFDVDSFAIIIFSLFIIFLCTQLSRYVVKAFIPYASHMKKEKNWYNKS